MMIKENLMPCIQNVSLADVEKGDHIPAGNSTVLIQIVDPDMDFPHPARTFKSTHQFKFLDLEKDNDCIDPNWKIQDHQAQSLVEILQQALSENCDVVVHCVAGVCRSGAVCEVGVMMGFDDTGVFRSPNLLVKHKMLRALGWYYDENEPHTINNVVVDEDWTNDNDAF
jgi:predicted protein tyrosine phosphatase